MENKRRNTVYSLQQLLLSRANMYTNSVCIEVEPDILMTEDPDSMSEALSPGDEEHDPLSLERLPADCPAVVHETSSLVTGGKTQHPKEQPLLMECEVKLEHITDNEAPDMSQKSQNIVSYKPCISTEVEIEFDWGNIKSETEDTYDCDVCSRRFALQSELWTHAMVCLPTSLRDEESGEKGTPGNKKLSRFPHRKLAVRECSVKLERVAASTRATPKLRTRNASQKKKSGETTRKRIRNCTANYILLDTGEKLYTCETCPKNFKTIKNLNLHKKTHTGAKPFQCDVCKHTFTRLGNLKMHLLIHSGDKQFSCKVCEKKFTQLGNLKTHERIHMGVKPYSCDVCKKSFTALSTLLTHKIVHNEERPYVCDICNKRYKRSDYLKEHKLTHSEEAYRYDA